MVARLTDRQRTVVEYIEEHQERYGISPTIREICSYLGLKSPAGVHKILQKLIEKNVLVSMPGKNRSWCLVSRPARKCIPLVGQIAAGLPIDAIENREEDLPLDPCLFGGDDCFALRVKGDSMIEAHIMDGDLAVVRPGDFVKNGQIAAVMVENILPEATLKRVYLKKSCIELHSANKLYSPLVFSGDECGIVRIIGQFVGLVRRRL